MKSGMDAFGNAMYAEFKGEKPTVKFCFDGKKYPYSLNHYFRTGKQLSRLEKKLISLSHGEILDVGCATGYYIPALMKKGKVTGIDISKKNIQIAQENGLKNCFVANIFKFKTKKKFDTITLLDNNLGMGEDIIGLKKLLGIFKRLLKKDGQILVMHKKVTGKSYFIAVISIEYNGINGEKFRWLNTSKKMLSKVCKEAGFSVELVETGKKHYLLRLKRSEVR